MKFLSEILVTLFYFGHSKKAPGTVGSAVSLILILPSAMNQSIPMIFLYTCVSFIIGFSMIPIHLGTSTEDKQEIVIDEMAGLYTGILISVLFANTLHIPISYYIVFIFCFILFRIFDITKPSIIGIADKKLKGTLGIMIDDILAGIFTGIIMVFLIFIYKLYIS